MVGVCGNLDALVSRLVLCRDELVPLSRLNLYRDEFVPLSLLRMCREEFVPWSPFSLEELVSAKDFHKMRYWGYTFIYTIVIYKKESF